MKSPEPYREERPWGEFVEFIKNTPSTVKIITVNPHQALSLQRHKKRDEFWQIISGTGMITIGDNKFVVKPNEHYYIPQNTNHRVEANSSPLVFLEISTGDFDENDIERLDDRYGRL